MIARRFFQTAATAKKTNYFLWIGIPTAATTLGGLYAYSTVSEKPKAKAIEYSPALDGQWKGYKLESVKPLNHNVNQYTFSLPKGATELGLPVAAALVCKYHPEGEEKPIIRPYTPVLPDSEGSKTFDLVVKVYKDGKLSKHISNLKLQEELLMKGPNLKFAYEANKDGHLGLVAGGSGLTPMLQLLQKIALNPDDKTKVDLVFANVEEKDIFLKDRLDHYAAMKPDQINIHYVLEKPPKGWKGHSGFVNEALMKSIFPGPNKGKVFVCGPPGMVAALAGPKAKDYSQGEIAGSLKKLGYTADQIFKF